MPTSSLHKLLPPPGEHPSITRLYESPQNFLASPPEPKNTNHSSHMLSPTIGLHNCFFSSVFIGFVCVCVCLLLLSTILFSLWLLLSINDIPYMTVARKVMYSPTVQQYSHRPILREIKLKINEDKS